MFVVDAALLSIRVIADDLLDFISEKDSDPLSSMCISLEDKLRSVFLVPFLVLLGVEVLEKSQAILLQVQPIGGWDEGCVPLHRVGFYLIKIQCIHYQHFYS